MARILSLLSCVTLMVGASVWLVTGVGEPSALPSTPRAVELRAAVSAAAADREARPDAELRLELRRDSELRVLVLEHDGSPAGA